MSLLAPEARRDSFRMEADDRQMDRRRHRASATVAAH